MTDHIEIRDRRSEILDQFEGIQVGRNGILGDYVNSIASIKSWLEFLNTAGTEIKFNSYLSHLKNLLNDVDIYEHWGLFHRRLGTLQGKSIYETPELYSTLFESDDIKPIIEAINKNVLELRKIGELLEGMTQEKWKIEEAEISRKIIEPIEKQNKLITLGQQDEVIESVDDISDHVKLIMGSNK